MISLLLAAIFATTMFLLRLLVLLLRIIALARYLGIASSGGPLPLLLPVWVACTVLAFWSAFVV